MHLGGIAVVFLAADPGAALRARLSRCPRGRASCRDESFGAVLAGGRASLSLGRARQEVARYLRQRSASLWHRGLTRDRNNRCCSSDGAKRNPGPTFPIDKPPRISLPSIRATDYAFSTARTAAPSASRPIPPRLAGAPSRAPAAVDSDRLRGAVPVVPVPALTAR